VTTQPEAAARTSADTPRDTAKFGRRLTHLQIAQILHLSAEGKSNLEIGRLVGCDDATVGRTLGRFGDTRILARKVLERGSVQLAETVVKTKDSAVALKALGKLDVVREDQASETNIAILMGTPEQPLLPPAIDITPLSPVPRNELAAENKG